MNRKILVMACAVTLLPAGLTSAADEHEHRHARADRGESQEVRQRVRFPAPLLKRELAQMRQHLEILGQLQAALARGAYTEAADLGEQSLGTSSLRMHRTEEAAKHMPPGMRAMETELLRAASRFAEVAANAAATGNGRPAIAALSEVMQRCVTCHVAYRFR